MNLILPALIITVAFFTYVWTLQITIFGHNFSRTMSQVVSEDRNHITHRLSFPKPKDSDDKGHVSHDFNVRMIKRKTSEIPNIILAAGDIAKCDGEDPWNKKFLKLVKILPDDGPQEPFLENLLELLFLSEETDYPAKAEMTARLVLRLPGKVLALGDLVYPAGSTQ